MKGAPSFLIGPFLSPSLSSRRKTPSAELGVLFTARVWLRGEEGNETEKNMYFFCVSLHVFDFEICAAILKGASRITEIRVLWGCAGARALPCRSAL